MSKIGFIITFIGFLVLFEICLYCLLIKASDADDEAEEYWNEYWERKLREEREDEEENHEP
jgi:hypothetical protein